MIGGQFVNEAAGDDILPASKDYAVGGEGDHRALARPGDPHIRQAAFLFGLSYHQEKSYGEAVAWYDRALETEPDFAMTHYWRGWARLYLGLAAEAGEDFERFLEVRPNDDDAWFAMGLLALETGRLDEAEARFRRALELLKGGPPRPTVRSRNLTRLADVALQRDRPDEAMELLRRAAELHEDNYEAHYKIHQLQVRAGETEAAERTRVLFEQAYRRVHPEVRFPE